MRATRADGPLIRQLREESGTSLTRFAQEIRLSIGYLSKIEQGTSNPSPEVTARIARRLGVTIRNITQQADQAAA